MKFAIVLACLVALAAAVEEKQPEADVSSNVEVTDQDVDESHGHRYYGYYNPYGYRNYYRGNYYGKHWRGRRSAPEDQAPEESSYPGWGYSHGYHRGYYYDYPSYYRPYSYYGRHYPSASYSHRYY